MNILLFFGIVCNKPTWNPDMDKRFERELLKWLASGDEFHGAMRSDVCVNPGAATAFLPWHSDLVKDRKLLQAHVPNDPCWFLDYGTIHHVSKVILTLDETECCDAVAEECPSNQRLLVQICCVVDALKQPSLLGAGNEK